MKTRIRIIFLDIDGVLSPHVKMKVDAGYFPYSVEFNPRAIKNLKRLLKESNAKIVLSTSWIKTLGFRATVIALASHGIMGPYLMAGDVGKEGTVETVYAQDWIDQSANKFYGTAITPKKFSSEKCHEISFWLEDYADKIDGYVVIDDDFMHFQEGYQVQVNGKKGLTSANVNKALEILNQGMDLYKKNVKK